MWIDETAMHRGWTIRPLKSLFSFSKGLNITKEDLCEEGTAVVSYGQIHSKNYHGTGIEEPIVRFVPSSKAADNVRSRVEIGGFLFADTSEDLEGIGNCAYNDSADELYGGYHTMSSIQSSVSITSTLPIFSRPMHGVRSFGAI